MMPNRAGGAENGHFGIGGRNRSTCAIYHSRLGVKPGVGSMYLLDFSSNSEGMVENWTIEVGSTLDITDGTGLEAELYHPLSP